MEEQNLENQIEPLSIEIDEILKSLDDIKWASAEKVRSPEENTTILSTARNLWGRTWCVIDNLNELTEGILLDKENPLTRLRNKTGGIIVQLRYYIGPYVDRPYKSTMDFTH